MGRATITDIARIAGVSTATVDRALNARAGVSPANRQRVLEAARDLGYLPKAGMVVLPSQPAHLEFLLPIGRSAFMQDLARAIEGFARDLPLVASCRVGDLGGIGPAALEAALDGLAMRTSGVGIVAVDSPRTRRTVARLREAGVRVAAIASDVRSDPAPVYVGIDNRGAGRTAAHLMGLVSRGAPGAVALFLGSHDFHGHRERAEGFTELLAEEFPHLEVLDPVETGEDARRSRPAMEALLRARADIVGVYCVGGGRTGIVEALPSGGPAPFAIVHELTENARRWLSERRVGVVIDQNAEALAEQAVIRLLGSIAAAGRLLPERDVEARLILRENLPERSGG